MNSFPCSGSYRAYLAGQEPPRCERCDECVDFDEKHTEDLGAFTCHRCIAADEDAQFEAEAGDDTPEPTQSPTEAFLADLRAIFAVNPKQAVADLADDTRTEGYARRHFRTNPHDN